MAALLTIIDEMNVVEFRDVKVGADDGDVWIESGLKEGVSVELNPDCQIAVGRNGDAHDGGVWLAGNHEYESENVAM